MLYEDQQGTLDWRGLRNPEKIQATGHGPGSSKIVCLYIKKCLSDGNAFHRAFMYQINICQAEIMPVQPFYFPIAFSRGSVGQ